MKSLRGFIGHHFRHFNASALKRAAQGYVELCDRGGTMFISLAGAMSTAEIGLSLAEMIRQKKVGFISCTGANLEEDVFNLVAHNHYVHLPDYRDLTAQDEESLLARHLNRVTDTCIPEEEAVRRIEKPLLESWQRADKAGQAYFPHEFFYQILLSGALKPHYQIDPKDSWLLAAAEANLPIVVPGWEDSTMGNVFASSCMRGRVSRSSVVRSGIDAMLSLANWYQKASSEQDIGFFQIGGGIAGDFPICVVPMLSQDLEIADVKPWAYFCQISDSTTSFGSYSGAVPNEKITWGKIRAHTPKHVIESDASIVAPLVFAYVLEESAKQPSF